jgi:hypothetical protein
LDALAARARTFAMKRLLACALAIVAVALLASACDDGPGYGYAYGPSPRGHIACGQLSTCATCTPEPGCGWCLTGSTGLCVDDPSDCPAASTTGWTWDPAGCRTALDASAIAVGDAGQDAARDAVTDAPSSD